VSVLGEGTIRARPYAGFEAPGLPTGVWAALVTVTGDATGGVRTALINFSIQGTIGGGNLFSLEQLSIADGANVSKLVQCEFVNMDGLAPTGAPFRNEFLYQLTLGPAASRAVRSPSQVSPLPIFAGIPRKGFSGSFSTVAVNVDAEVLQVEAQGYVWAPRSLNTDGGLRRPPSGLFSPT